MVTSPDLKLAIRLTVKVLILFYNFLLMTDHAEGVLSNVATA